MERSKDWINEAEGDLQHAQNDLEGGFYNWACFSAQQCSEKAIKAVFYRMKAEVWGHSVSDLLIELSKHHSVPSMIIDDAIELDKSYIAARYPDAHPSGSPRSKYTEREARRLIKYADNIFQFCSGLLSEIQ
jgi:HEPN domain-containing protein